MAKAALSAVDKSAKTANIASAVSAGGDIASTAINLIAGISDQRKRALFQQNFSALTADQQKKLNELVLDANSETERLTILSNALSASNIQRINNLASMYAENERKKRNQKLLIIGGFFLFGIAAIAIIYKKA